MATFGDLLEPAESYRNGEVFHYFPEERDSIHVSTNNMQSHDEVCDSWPLSNGQLQLSHWPDSLRGQVAANTVPTSYHATGLQPQNWQWPIVRSSGHEDSDRARGQPIVLTPICPRPSPHCLPVVSIPSNMDFPGMYNFRVIGEKYSDQLRVLFAKQDSLCPVRFCTSPDCKQSLFFLVSSSSRGKTSRTSARSNLGLPPSGCQVRAQMRFRNAVNSKEIVRRCPRHREEGEDNLTPGQDSGRESLNHFIVCDNTQSVYSCCQHTKQLSVASPFVPPCWGQSEYVGEVYSFKCFSSCYTKKGPLQVVFSLEVDGQVVGRQTVNVHISASPGRDRRRQEAQSGLGVQVGSPDSTMPPTPPAETFGKRQKLSHVKAGGEDSVYTLTIQGRQRFKQLEIISKALDASNTLKCIPLDVIHYYQNRRDAETDKGQASSPSTECPVCSSQIPSPRNTAEAATQTKPVTCEAPNLFKGVRFSLRRMVSFTVRAV